ncbi:MAG: F0F1 ATP synthase subunit alpha [Candidatus Eremiobacteraeota bacterium]|nr:F0F1 ATP synthase subunit alpha [Candidatus Eremiobacteraeota bacterium]MBV9736543.1 F0F1 ATP synthase subunit alpha [Candidatus Eremiobacteraeota bacterium]
MINADEIAGILKQQIASFKSEIQEDQVGTVIEVGANLARVYGLDAVRASELVEFPNGLQGVVLNLEEDNVGVVIMGPDTEIQEGDKVRRTGRIASVPVGDALLGRTVNPLGQPIDDKGPINATQFRTIENVAPSVVDRQPVKQPLQTGIRVLDALIPIGRGQRELIIGDRSTGKTAIALDTIINQRGKNVICIYVAIGQKNSTVAAVAQILESRGAMEYTTIVAAGPSEAAALKWMAPYAGCAMGEEFMYQGKDVLIIYDDLTKHAQAYREMSLLLRRPPGREAYPGDVFYLHSRLLERAAKLSDARGGGSLTALPIIETQAGDFAAYIPTNVISITDGQIYLTPQLFFQGIRPAVDVGLSVSRVGGNAQTKAMKSVAGRLKLELAQYRDLAAFAKLASDLDKATQMQLQRGEKLTELLKQPQYDPQPMEDQVAIIWAATNGYVMDVPTDRLQEWARGFVDSLHAKYEDIPRSIASSGQLADDVIAKLEEAVKEYNKSF